MTLADKRTPRKTRDDYVLYWAMPTRWSDNDQYGHINNTAYYGYFDTAINSYLISKQALDANACPVIGVVVETGCRFFSSLSYPEILEVGISVVHIGNSSVRYELGVFRAGCDTAAACGHFVHVYVDRDTRHPTSIPSVLKKALEALQRPSSKSE